MSDELFKRSKKFTAGLILFAMVTISFSPFFTRLAEAQLAVIDASNLAANSTTAANATSNTAKEYGLDSLAWMVANLIIQRMAASTVNWINSGFNGSPAYVTNTESYFESIADAAAGQYIYYNTDLSYLCGSMSAKVKIALANSRSSNSDRFKCTLTNVVSNVNNFMDSFENGGWEAFFTLTQVPQNNAIGAYLQAESEMNQKIATQKNNSQNELNWGSGFMSWQECSQYQYFGDYKLCTKKTTKTPGSVIQTQLNKTLGNSDDRLNVADEMNEIVSALLNQLTKTVIGGLGSLMSASESSSSGSSLTSSLADSTVADTTDYFGNTQDTSILDSVTDTSSSVSTSIPTTVYDSTGIAHSITFTLTPTTITNEWTWEASVGGSETILGGGSGTVLFNSDGSISNFEYTGSVSALTIEPNNGASVIEINIAPNLWTSYLTLS